MTAALTIRYEPALRTYVVRLEGSTGYLTEAQALMDAQRIAQGISSWTQLPVIDLSGR